MKNPDELTENGFVKCNERTMLSEWVKMTNRRMGENTHHSLRGTLLLVHP